MRKKTTNHFFDTLFWYLLYFLPVIAYLIYLATGVSDLTISTFFSNIGLGFTENNIILNALSSMFGVNGFLPFFTNNTAFYFFSWFIITVIIHLVCDFLIFIPRLCHKWLKEFTRGE